MLNVRNLTFSYPASDLPALEDITFSAQPGEIVGVFGKSGCGKSTLLRVLAGFGLAASGSVELNGRVIDRPTPAVVLVHQYDGLWPWMTVADNALFRYRRVSAVKETPSANVEQIFHQLGLPPEILSRFPRSLSIGMRKRVEIIRATLASPELLLLDEPFAGLDRKVAEVCADYIATLARREMTIVVLAAHDLGVICDISSKILAFDGRAAGHASAVGNPKEKPASPGNEFYQRAVLEAVGWT